MSEKNSDNITNTKQFTSGLNIEANVGCKLNINYAPAGDDRITVRVTGTKRRVDAITVEERGGDIVINESYGDGNVAGGAVASGSVFVNHGNVAHVGPVFGSVVVRNGQTISGRGAVGVNMSGGRIREAHRRDALVRFGRTNMPGGWSRSDAVAQRGGLARAAFAMRARKEWWAERLADIMSEEGA